MVNPGSGNNLEYIKKYCNLFSEIILLSGNFTYDLLKSANVTKLQIRNRNVTTFYFGTPDSGDPLRTGFDYSKEEYFIWKQKYQKLWDIGFQNGTSYYSFFKTLESLSLNMRLNDDNSLNVELATNLQNLELNLTKKGLEDSLAVQQFRLLLTRLMVSDNGLRNFSVNLQTPIDLDMDTVILHNAFGKANIETFTITGVRKFYPVKEMRLDQTFLEAMQSRKS